MEITYNLQGVPSIGFDRIELSELERKEFRIGVKDHKSGRNVDLTLTPFLDTTRKVIGACGDSYRFNLDGDVRTLRTQKVLPLKVYEGFTVYLTC